jgi:formyltetrahydrofolate hydrolase
MNAEKAIARIVMILFNVEHDILRWICSTKVGITHNDTVQDLVSKGKDLEKIVLSRAVQKHIERKVLAYKNKTVIFS